MRVRSTDVQRYLRHFTLFYAYLASHLSLPAGPDDSGGKNVHDERLAPYSLTGVASVEWESCCCDILSVPPCQPQQPAEWRAGPVWVESWTVSPPWAARQLTASLPPVPAMHYLHFLPSLHLLLPPRARVAGRVHSGVSPGHWVSRAVTCEGAESCSWTGSARWKVSAIMSLICHFLAGAPETRGELSWAEGWQWDPLPSAPFIKVLWKWPSCGVPSVGAEGWMVSRVTYVSKSKCW